jgi:carboxyl-terminal processing protease
MAVRRKDGIWLALMAVIVIAGGQIFNYVDAQARDMYASVSDAADDRYQVESAIMRYYVEKVDPAKLQLAEIDGLIGELDNFSDFLGQEEQEALRITLEGGFGGLGIEINVVDHYPTVISPLEDTPAWEVGLQAGDKIVDIEGKPTRDEKLSNIVKKLRGVPGTVVKIKVKRAGVGDPIPFAITRARIVVHSVTFAGMINESTPIDPVVGIPPTWLRAGQGIAYIRLAHFHRGATKDVRKALIRLKEQDLRGVVLDLRTNPGGLLEEARGVSDLFLPTGRLIVSSKGRTVRSERKFFSRSAPVIPESVPMVVLVNGASASASEIVAGAIQDNDRGLVVGQNTYGKGSVQTVYNARFGARYGLAFSPKAELKLTTAYYYSPSGRCIHRPRWRDRTRKAVLNGAARDTARYATTSGRTVVGGGGIAPDVKVDTRFKISLLGLFPPRVLFHDFAFKYAAKHPDMKDTPGDMGITSEMIAEFKEFVSDTSRGFRSQLEGEKQLDDLKKLFAKGAYSAKVLSELEDLKNAIRAEEPALFRELEPFIRGRLLTSLADKVWGRKASTRAGFYNDDYLKQALLYLNDTGKYSTQLAQSPPKTKQPEAAAGH